MKAISKRLRSIRFLSRKSKNYSVSNPPMKPPKPTKPSKWRRTRSSGRGASTTATATTTGRGCYLDYDPTSSGVLYCQWSETAVEEPRAYFKPHKPVPAFKFKQRQGRMDLIKGLTVSKEKYFQGWLQFVKMAREHFGEFMLMEFEDRDIDLFCLDSKSRVFQVFPNVMYDLTDVESVAVVPRYNTEFEGLNVVNKSHFRALARIQGETITFQR